MPSELLPPFGQWAFGESRVQKNIECDPCAKNIFVIRVIRVQKSHVPHVSAPLRTKIREIGAIRVPKNIRVIRVIRVQKNSW